MQTCAHSLIILVAGLGLAACGGGSNTPDAHPRPDGGIQIDGPPGQPDAAADAPIGTPDADLTPDADVGVSAQIAAALATPDGSGLSLPIDGATVTYIKPPIGSTVNDPEGFTIQGAQTGPALFVAVDLSLRPPIEVGDTATFTITAMTTIAGQHRATAISGLTAEAAGADVNALVQDLSAATDVVTAIDQYDSEVVDVTGTIDTDPVSSGTGYKSVVITTAGITGDTNYKLRVTTGVANATGLSQGCTFAVNNTPMNRFNAQAEVSAYYVTDLSLSNCPAPTVVSAISLSSTTVRVTFSRNIDFASVDPSGSQFSFTGGLVASAASQLGVNFVDVTTGTQAAGTSYTVTVAASVTDLQGTGIGTPNSATFTGFSVPAVLAINELNANIANGCDLLELRVVSGGSLSGIHVHSANVAATLLTFPTANVATNDIIVIHFDSTDVTNCNPNSAGAETASVIEQPSASFAGNFDTAYDYWVATNGMAATSNVLTIYDVADAVMDAVFVVNDAGNAAVAGATETEAAIVASAGQWQNVGGGTPPGGYIDIDFSANAALELDATGTNAAGNTIQRLDNTDDNDKDDWNTAVITTQPPTWGLMNVGQTPF